MSDICEELRKASTHALMSASRQTVLDAAAEIERLRLTARDHFAAAALALALFSGGCSTHSPTTAPTKSVITVCSGCGTEWESFGDGPRNPITKCPNCPMSEEEFESLKEAIRKQREAKK